MLNRRQRKLIEELFESSKSEEALFKQIGIRPGTLADWLREPEFAGAIEERIDRSNLSSRLLIARAKPVAAKTLISLMHSDKEETARKACLDVMGFEDAKAPAKREQKDAAIEIEAEKAERILRILAE